MPAYTTVDLLKKHVRADDFTDDDELLEAYLEVAEEYVIGRTNQAAEDLLTDGELPKMLQQAVYLYAGHLFANREAVAAGTFTPVPYTIESLIKPYVVLVADTSSSEDDSDSEEEETEE